MSPIEIKRSVQIGTIVESCVQGFKTVRNFPGNFLSLLEIWIVSQPVAIIFFASSSLVIVYLCTSSILYLQVYIEMKNIYTAKREDCSPGQVINNRKQLALFFARFVLLDVTLEHLTKISRI